MVYRRLKDLREDHDLTQAELAGILNISQRGYSHYETGNNDIPTEILIKLANYYNVSIYYILERTNQKEHKKETILSH